MLQNLNQNQDAPGPFRPPASGPQQQPLVLGASGASGARALCASTYSNPTSAAAQWGGLLYEAVSAGARSCCGCQGPAPPPGLSAPPPGLSPGPVLSSGPVGHLGSPCCGSSAPVARSSSVVLGTRQTSQALRQEGHSGERVLMLWPQNTPASHVSLTSWPVLQCSVVTTRGHCPPTGAFNKPRLSVLATPAQKQNPEFWNAEALSLARAAVINDNNKLRPQ